MQAVRIGLRQSPIQSTGDATRAFGEDAGLIIARPSRSIWNPVFFTVPEGFYALVSDFGRIVDYDGPSGPQDCWPAGFHWGHPMKKVLYLVTQQAIVFDAPCRGVLTKDNVGIQIDVAIVFRILEKDVKQFAVKVNPKDLEIRLQAQVDQAVKNLGREITTRDAYGLRSVRTTTVETMASMDEGHIEEEGAEEAKTVSTGFHSTLITHRLAAAPSRSRALLYPVGEFVGAGASGAKPPLLPFELVNRAW